MKQLRLNSVIPLSFFVFILVMAPTIFGQLFKGSQHPDSKPYERPLRNFGTSASELTKEEREIIDAEVFTPDDWCQLYKLKVDSHTIHRYPPSNVLKCRPAHFGLNESNLIGKLRELEPINGCSEQGIKIKTALDDDLNKDTIIGVVHRGECPFIQKARNAEKAGVKALIVVDNDQKSKKLLTLIGDGDDAYTYLSIPVVSVLASEKKLLSIPGTYFRLNFGNDMDWKKKENLWFWEKIVEKFPNNPKFKMRLGTAFEISFPDNLEKAELTYRSAIGDCEDKDPRSIYAYFKLGVMLARRKSDLKAWEEASSFLKGYKKYLVTISTIMLDEHLFNKNQEDNDDRILPYVTKVLRKAESIHGGKKFEEPRTYYNLGRLNEHVGNYTTAMNYYMLAHRSGEKRADREMYEQGYADYMRLDKELHQDEEDDDEIDAIDSSENNQNGGIKIKMVPNEGRKIQRKDRENDL